MDSTASPGCERTLPLPRTGLGGAYDDFGRAAELAGAAPIRPRLVRRALEKERTALCAESGATPWSGALRPAPRLEAGPLSIELLPIGSRAIVNTAYPVDRNNGALWAGRGLSTELRGGVEVRLGPLSAALAPALLYQQNRDFEIAAGPIPAGYSPYIYLGHPRTIDWPQRFGDRHLGEVDLGQSYVRLDVFRFALGLSNENLWWGPALRNPILMSNTAPGFPHLFVGSSRPVDLGIGRFEVQAIWGRITESDYFDFDRANDHLLLAGLVADFEPRWVPGLFLGGTRVYLRDLPRDGLPFSTWFLGPYRDIRDNPLGRYNSEADNQLMSAFVRWAPPRSGFEMYAEYARDDHWEDLRDLIAEPDHSQAFTVGFQKVVPRGERWLRISAEATQLARSVPGPVRGFFTIYTHGQLRQGYTHRGRMLGASIGPTSNAQFLGVDRFTPSGRYGLFVERVRYDQDANRDEWARRYGAEGADVEWSTGIDHLLRLRRFDLGWALTHSYRQNRKFIGLNSDPVEFTGEHNWSLRFDLGWRPGGRDHLAAPRTTVPVVEGGR